MENYQEEREMTISHKDFYRLLPIALKNVKYRITENKIFISYQNGQIEIHPGEELSRTIASLKLPVLKVIFIFKAISKEDVSGFLSNFRRVYQKGGG